MVELLEGAVTADSTIADVARAMPQTIAVFEDAGIDFSCKGARTLADAAASAGFGTDELISMLQKAPAEGETDWTAVPLPQLIRFLLREHDSTISEMMSKLREAVDEVVTSVRMPEARRISTLLANFATKLNTHMLNEERDLFPTIEYLESAVRAESAEGPKPRIGQRVLRELIEHDALRDRLRTMRELSCRLPSTATGVWQLREALRVFSSEVHHHMHLENNVLYPRAVELENALRRV